MNIYVKDNNNTYIEHPIKEPKFILNRNITEEYIQFMRTPYIGNQSLFMVSKTIFEHYWPLDNINKESNRTSLFTYICEISDIFNQSEKYDQLNHLCFRILCFRIKMAVFRSMSHRENIKITNDIIYNLKRGYVFLGKDKIDIEGLSSLNFDNTIAHIKKHLTENENYLRYGMGIRENSLKAVLTKNIKQCLRKIKSKLEQENCFSYIISLVLLDNINTDKPPMFNEQQLKQWNTYIKEIHYLLAEISKLKEHICVDDFDFFKMQPKNNIINIPLDPFMKMTSCSKNTFSQIIISLNFFMPVLWLTFLKIFYPK